MSRDARGVGLSERSGDHIEYGERVRRHAPELNDARLVGERLQPQRFDTHPLANQAVFAEQRAQVRALPGVASIDGRNGSQAA